MTAIVLDCEAIAFVDITAVRMLRDLAGDLSDENVQLVLAKELGQVRDIMDRDADALTVYPTVQAAVDALHTE